MDDLFIIEYAFSRLVEQTSHTLARRLREGSNASSMISQSKVT